MSHRRKDSSDRRKAKQANVKEYYELISPKYFGEQEIGQTPAKTPESVIGRIVEISLADITKDYAVMHIKLKFKVYEVVGKKAHTRFVGSDFTIDYLKSLVRRQTTRVDGIFNIITNDGYKMRITSLVFTESRIAQRHKFTIRKIMKEIIEEEANSLSFSEFVKSLIYGQTATNIYKKSRKIAPIRKVEILKTKILEAPTVAS